MLRPIKTERLVLRHYTVADVPALARQLSAFEVQRWLPNVPHPYDESEAQAFMDRAKVDPWKLAIALDGMLIGGISISEEFGYWLGSDWWGRGLATEAAHAMVASWYAKRSQPLASGHLVGNDASRNILLKLGFRDSRLEEVDSKLLGSAVKLQRMRLEKSYWKAAA